MSALVEQELELLTPKCLRGLGKIITSRNSSDLIDGVRINEMQMWPDDRGYFLEVARLGTGLPADFPPATTQVSAALSYPGTIKAFHFHKVQFDCWVPITGMLQVALVDLRRHSPTHGARNTFYVGQLRPWQFLIPPGVAHGYKVIGLDPVVLVYLTSRVYDPSDEGRMPHNDEQIQYDWETQFK